MVQWLRLHVVNPESVGLIPDRGTKIPHIVQYLPSKKKKKNEEAALPKSFYKASITDSVKLNTTTKKITGYHLQ